MEADLAEIEEARRSGRLDAEKFDRALIAREHAERDERLAEIGGGRFVAQERSDRSEVIWRQQREIERLAEWHRAVAGSRPWRLIQALRRPLGRAW